MHSLCSSVNLCGAFACPRLSWPGSAGRKFDRFPVAANDGFTNILCAAAFTIHLVGKENLLETDLSASRMIVNVTIKQAAVTEAFIAKTVAGLLRQHIGNAARCLISVFH